MKELLGRRWRAATTGSTSDGSSPRRLTMAAATGLLALSAVGGLQAPASAALSRVGALDPETLFPSSYADENGLALALCLDGDPLCFAGSDFLKIHKDGGDAEAFYYAADAEVGPITVHNALEAAYAADGDGQEVTFMRTQVSAQTGGLKAGAKYMITDPYGVLTCTADSSGQIRNNACRTETAPTPGNFNVALTGRIGPFLTWDTYIDPALPGSEPPAGYIGDNATPHRVLGSPTGFNKVRVEGPGISGTCTNADGTTVTPCQETDLFILQGKVQPGVSSALSASSWDFGNVPAASPATRSFTLTNTSSDGTSLDLTGVTVTGSADFAVAGSCTTAAALAAGSSCTVEVSYLPTGGPETDTASVTIATDRVSRSFNVTGRSVGVPELSGASSLAFVDQALGSASAENNVVVGNSGAAASNLTSYKIVGTGFAHFTMGSTNTCATPIEPGAGCELGVVFAPTTTGLKNATLQLFFDGATTNPLTVPLSGTGVVTAPGAPTGVTAAPGNTSATVTWTAPTATGGAAVSTYELTVRNATGAVVQTITPATSPQTITGLANGTTYTVQVQARNSVGLGAPAQVFVQPVDSLAPVVTRQSPAAGATGVSRLANVNLTFSEAITGFPAATSGTATVRLRTTATGRNVPAAVSYNAATRVLRINPSATLTARTSYTVQLTQGLKDLAGNRLAAGSWTFTTGR